MQIARQTRPRDLEEFFSAVGSVRDVRIITDSRTGRSKGIAYVEFWEEESVPLGLALSGQKLLGESEGLILLFDVVQLLTSRCSGAPLVIQRTCAERNRAANATIGTSLGFGPAPSKVCGRSKASQRRYGSNDCFSRAHASFTCHSCIRTSPSPCWTAYLTPLDEWIRLKL